MHLLWERGNEIESNNEGLICLYSQPRVNMLPCPIMGSFSPNSPVQNGLTSSSERNFNPEEKVLCRLVTSSLLGKEDFRLRSKDHSFPYIIASGGWQLLAGVFSILMLCLVHRTTFLPINSVALSKLIASYTETDEVYLFTLLLIMTPWFYF